MARFLEDDIMLDGGAVQSHLDAQSNQRILATPEDTNGGISNEYYLNDYRNRMPFHYVESGDDGYYYWHYGATMIIELEFDDLSIAVTDDTPPYLVDIKRNGESITGPNMTVNLLLGSMADESAENYYTKEQLLEKLSVIWGALNTKTSNLLERSQLIQQRMDQVNSYLEDINNDLYDPLEPKYLMSRQLAGNNIRISNTSQGDGIPKLKIDSLVTRQVPAIITSGTGELTNPFIAETAQPIEEDLSNTLLILLFFSLPKTGLIYDRTQQYYLQFTSINGPQFLTTLNILNDSQSGTLYNTTYFVLNGLLFDPQTIEQIRVFTAEQDNYEVIPGKPFIFIRGDKNSIRINGTDYQTALGRNSIWNNQTIEIQIEQLSSTIPIQATVARQGEDYQLLVDISRTSYEDLQNIIQGQVIEESNVAFTPIELVEEDWE